jgi:nucleoid-associated protein YgaU
MRKDVKLGFTIGGVLLAVLIVYVLVVSSGPPQHRNDVSLVKPELAPADAGPAGASGKQSGEAAAASAPKPSSSDREVDAAKIDPFKPTIPATDASKSPQPTPGVEDKWAAALNTGKVPAEQLPLLMTKTPTPSDARNGGGSATPANAVSADGASSAKAPGDQNASDSAAAATPPPPGPSVAGGGESIASQILGSGSSTQPSETSSGASAAAPATGARTHVVQRGESFATIAAAVYGNSAYYPHLLRANPNIDPKKLKPGMTVTIPDPAQVVAAHNGPVAASHETPSAVGTNSGAAVSAASSDSASAKSAAPAIDEKSQYRVQASDSLYKISLRLYGKADRVDKLYELNKDVIGANPAHLKAGMVLKLPEAPTSGSSATAAR